MSEQRSANEKELLEQQRALAEFGELALKSESLNTILEEACSLVGRALETDLSKVMELLPDGTNLLVRAGVGWKPGVVGTTIVAADETSPEGLTLKDGAVISVDRATETRFSYHDFMEDHGVEAFVNVLVPSSKERRPFGVLEVDSRRPREFSESDIDFLRSYANLLGAAIERLRVVEELRKTVKDKDLLLNELNHRVKNTLATVQSIASQTLRNAPTMDDASTAMERRLFALSKVHNVLTDESWSAVSLHAIVDQALEPFRGDGESRIHVRGPYTQVHPRMALALAMALQELVTNAIKYGALSNSSGEVSVLWTIDRSASAERLELTWEETGGPLVQKPTHRGFGTRLIERSLAQDLDGIVQIDFAPTGVVCTVDAPLILA